MSAASRSVSEQHVHRQMDQPRKPDEELQCAEVDFDLHASMLYSDGWKEGPSRTRVYRQVRTDVFEFFTEVRSTGGIWHRFLPWKRRTTAVSRVASAEAEILGPAQQASVAVCNFGIVLGGYVSGVLGGMAVITFLHLNLFNVNTPVGRSDLALHYYAPVALAVNRTYWGLICIAISSSISRFYKPSVFLNQLSGRQERVKSSWISIVLSMSHSGHRSYSAVLACMRSAIWSSVAVVCYILAFIANIAHSALDSELDYAVDRNHDFYSTPLPQKFLDRVQTWRILNTLKSLALIIAWFAVVVEWQPRGMAQLIQDIDKGNMKTVHEKHQNINTQSSLNCKDAATGVEESCPQFGNALDSTILHTNAAFHDSFSKSMPIYPSAGAGIA